VHCGGCDVQLGCCGAFGYQDYTRTNLTSSQKVPVSCCTVKSGPGSIPTKTSEFKNHKACLNGDENYINTQVYISVNDHVLCSEKGKNNVRMFSK